MSQLETKKLPKIKEKPKTKKVFVSNLFVEKGCTESDIDLIYMKKLPYAMKKIIPFFFDQGVEILDVTTGFKKLWAEGNHQISTLDNEKPFCKVTFLDGSSDSKADVIGDFRKLPFPDNSFDLIVFDPPFTEIKNSLEQHTGIKNFGSTFKPGRRAFYFRGINGKWIPPEAYFFQTWKEFNRVSRNGLIVKISERFQNLEEIPVLTYLDLAYNRRFNKKSEFQRCVNVGYRGKRKATGARSGNPQRVLSNYVVFKKNRRQR